MTDVVNMKYPQEDYDLLEVVNFPFGKEKRFENKESQPFRFKNP